MSPASAPGLSAMLEGLSAFASAQGGFGTWVLVERRCFQRRQHRAGVELPVVAVESVPETWEICIRVNGLDRRNAVPRSQAALGLGEFVSKLRHAVDAQPNFRVVLSDEREISREELKQMIARSPGSYSGVPIDEVGEELRARMDLPLLSVAAVARLEQSRVLLRCMVPR